MSQMYMIKYQYIDGYLEHAQTQINKNKQLSELFKLHKIDLQTLYEFEISW